MQLAMRAVVVLLLAVVASGFRKTLLPSRLSGRSSANGFVSTIPNLTKFSVSKPIFATLNSETANTPVFPSLKLKDTAGNLIDAIGKYPAVDVSSSVLDAVQQMNTLGKGSVLVLDKSSGDNKLAGIFTERDFVQKVMDAERDSSEVPIIEAMTREEKLVTASADTLLVDCKQIMFKNNIRHLPIVDADGRPMGVISMRDIVVSMQNEDLMRAKARFTGNTLQEIQDQVCSNSEYVILIYITM